MPDFNVRSDSVDVEQVMDQIRARIRDKRGVDYTDDQIRELAEVKLEKFIDPRGIRSDLLERFKQSQPTLTVPLYPFEETTLFDSHRGFVRFFRRLFGPLLKLFFNANAVAQSLHQQSIINRQNVDRLEALEQRRDLYYEIMHNLVLELTRTTIEVKNAKMRVESIASRLEFNERRARALESAVVYRPSDDRQDAKPAAAPSRAPSYVAPREAPRPAPPVATQPQPVPAAAPAPPVAATAAVPAEGPGQRSRKRRRRRGRRGGASAVDMLAGAAPAVQAGQADAAAGSVDASTDDEMSEDARETRAEPLETAFGTSVHPAERQDAEPSAPGSPAPPPIAAPAPSDAPDDDGQ
jgi:hypothetical protein